MSFDRIIRKISKKREFRSANEFNTTLNELISELKEKYTISLQKEETFKHIYKKKLDELDFKESKHAIESSRQQLVESLELDAQLDFLKTISFLVPNIDNNLFNNPSQAFEFNEVANQIINLKLIKDRVNRRLLTKRFNKFVIETEKSLLEHTSESEITNTEVEKVFQEIKQGKAKTGSVDDEIDKIIEEIKAKKKNQ